MLRPATPLTILFVAAFALLLLSVLSTPIIKAIPLATFEGVDFGVFGYCEGNKCSGFTIGYSTDGIFGDSSADDDFNLPSSARHSLSSLLIVHPIAAFLTLVCACLAAAAHFHSPSHSSKYLLALVLLIFPTLLVTLLAFLVDVLLFVPHLSWGGWIVLAATIIILIDGILVCAMRRTLVSRKARQRRIAENAEMNGDNFYARQNLPKADSPPPLDGEPKVPMVNGAPGANKLPEFATYDATRKSEEDRIPLNQQRSPSDRQLPSRGGSDGSERYGSNAPPGRVYNGPRDEYGNPLPPAAAYGGPRNGPQDPRMVDQYGRPMGAPRGRGGPMMRGGMPPRGRGTYPPVRGGYGRGYGPPGRGAGPVPGPGPRGPPPQGYNPGYQQGYNSGGYNGPPQNSGYGPTGGRGVMMAGAAAGMMAGGSRGPPPGYNPAQPHMQAPPPGGYGAAPTDDTVYAPYNAAATSSQPERQNSADDGPVGQAVVMNESSGQLSPRGFGENTTGESGNNGYSLRDSDADVQGMVGLQQNRQESTSSPDQQVARKPIRQASSVYSSPSVYVPPRAGWAATNRKPSPLNTQQNVPPMPVSASPVQMAGSSPIAGPPNAMHTRKPSGGSANYYEDVDPRFVEPDVNVMSSNPTDTIASSGALMDMNDARHPSANPAPLNIHKNAAPNMPLNDSNSSGLAEGSAGNSAGVSYSYENLHEIGARSPAASEASHFTSISQRGVNPNWRPGPGDIMPGMPGGGAPGGAGGAAGPGGYLRPNQAQAQMRRDVLLGNNPDFELQLPSGRGRGGRGGAMGLGGMGRYPGT